MMEKLTTSEMNRLTIEEFRAAEKLPVVIILDNIRSQNNTGSIFRTADSFRLEAVFLCGITATPPHREIHKTALGATESVKWEYFSRTADAITKLRSKDYIIVAVEQAHRSIRLPEFVLPENKKIAFVFGNEVHGVDEEILSMADAILEIPQYGTKHSLNVAVSVGIVIWHIVSENFL